MKKTQEKYFEWSLLALILLLGYALIYQSLPFLNGILAAITLYVLLRKINFKLQKKFTATKVSWFITLIITTFVLIPISLIIWYLIDLVQNLQIDPKLIIQDLTEYTNRLEAKLNINLISDDSMSFFTKNISKIFNMVMSGVNNFAVNLFTAILLLFFLLQAGQKIENYVAKVLPFNYENKKEITKKIVLIVKSNAIGIPLLAILQGIIAYIGYYFFLDKNPLMYALLTAFASVIPIVGTMLIWIPIAIARYLDGDIYNAIGIAIYGIVIISQCDNVLRMFLQKKLADTHPLITIAGVIVGLPIFGFMGIIFGPLLVSLFLLFTDMFATQYLMDDDNSNNTENNNVQNKEKNENKEK